MRALRGRILLNPSGVRCHNIGASQGHGRWRTPHVQIATGRRDVAAYAEARCYSRQPYPGLAAGRAETPHGRGRSDAA